MLRQLKRLILGRELKTAHLAHERLTNVKALAVFSSDALSSVAYATEEILLVLVLGGAAALSYTLPVAVAIAVLLAVVAISYRQTIHGYPSGGGAYIVARDNLGTGAGLTAAAALLIDYVLTVSVSVAAGVAAITSAFPALFEHRVLLGIGAIALITLANLRGVRESGTIFAIPTYLFVASMFLLIIVGLLRVLAGMGVLPVPLLPETGPLPAAVPALAGAPDAGASIAQPVTLFLLLRAFAAGCTALTGVEAISNGVPAFRAPEAPNAARTLSWMASILVAMFLGISYLAAHLSVVPREGETVVSQVARAMFGAGPLYYLLQATTALILVLAANTSFADFPRLASLLARDQFLPSQFAYRGDRLVFSNGIAFLGLLSALLVWFFDGNPHALIPMYALGVFISFSLSQAGMVVHWRRLRPRDWVAKVAVNGLGAVATGVVLVVIGVTKFAHGAWAVVVLIPLLVRMFHAIHSHYREFKQALAIHPVPAAAAAESGQPGAAAGTGELLHTVLVPIGHINKAVLNTLQYARSISPNVQAVYVALDREKAKQVRAEWEALETGVPLVVLDSPYRSVVGPLLHFIDREERRHPDHVITVLLPEIITSRWWHALLHNQTALYIKTALLFHPGVVVTSVPYHLHR